MRRAVLPIVLAGLLLGGCGRDSPGESEDPARRLLTEGAEGRERGASLLAEARALRDRRRVAEAEAACARGMASLRKALADCDRAIALLREEGAPPVEIAAARAERAMVRFQMGHSQLALLDATEAAAAAAPEPLPAAHYVRALALNALGDLRAAARAIDRAAGPDGPRAHRELGAAIHRELARWYRLYLRPDLGRTIASLRRAWEIHPVNEANGGTWRELQRLEREYERGAWDAMRHGAAASEPDRADLDLALVHARYGRYAEADHLFASLTSPERMGRDPALLLLLARHRYESLDTLEGYERAEALVREARAADPDLPGVEEALRRIEKRRRSLEASRGR